jgi:hypothetical protein
MQYHYVVMYDDEAGCWDLIGELDGYMPDGNVYDPSDEQYGWFQPSEYDEDDHAYVIDERCWNTLSVLVSTFPNVEV